MIEIDFAANLRQSPILADTRLPGEWQTITVHVPNVAQVRAWCERLGEEHSVVNRDTLQRGSYWSYSWFQSLPDHYSHHLNSMGNRLGMMEHAHRRGAYRAGQAVLALKYAIDTIEHVRFQADRTSREYRQLIHGEEQQFPI